MGQGHMDKARAVLVKYHGNGNPDSLVVKLELEEMEEVIELEGSDKRWWDYRGLFNSRQARYRTFLVTCIAWFGQLDLPPTSYYFPLMGQSYSPINDPLFPQSHADSFDKLKRLGSVTRRLNSSSTRFKHLS